MKEKIRTYIEKHHLLVPEKTVLVALSGGPDSVALLLLLKELQYPLIALHCNFHLRGEESDQDQYFVEELCRQNDIPMLIEHFSTKEYAQEHHISIEMAARELRYTWFANTLKDTQAQAVAVGHHQDDQAETLLLNLIRGTGLRGLAGMHPRQGKIVRPFLSTNRQDIIEYLHEHSQSYRIDHTNLERETKRNHIRLDIVPLLKSLNPRVIENIAKTADILRESLPIYLKGIEEEEIKKNIGFHSFPLAALKDETRSSILLHEWLRGKGFSTTQETEMLEHTLSDSGKIWESDTYRVLFNRGSLLLRNKRQIQKEEIALTYTEVEEIGHHNSQTIYVDRDTIQIPLLLRKVRQGDRFVPFGMRGSRLLSDFLTDQKMSVFEKEEQWLACSGEDIVWVVGNRADNRFRVTEKTKRILKIEIEKPQIEEPI